MTTFGRHDLSLTPEGRYHCRACGQSWKQEPSGGCAAKRAPSTLDSRSRPHPLCRACFQQPAQRTGLCAACILDLRSREQAAQERQRILDRQEAVREARAVLEYQHAALAIRFAGFGTDAEPCQIAVVDYDGDVIFSQFIKPAHPIPLASTRIHGISQAHVARARPFAHSVEALFDALDGHIVITDGAAFITAALGRACEEAEWEGLPGAQWVCMRTLFATFTGDWAPRAKRYRTQPLPERRSGVLAEATAVLNRLRAVGGLAPLRTPVAPRSQRYADELVDDADRW